MTHFNKQQDIHYSPSSALLLCMYPVQPVCTFLLHIPACIIIYKVHSILFCTFYIIAHFILRYFIFLFFLHLTYIYVYSLLLCYIFCTVYWAELTWLTFHYWFIFCIIEYVTDKPWILELNPWILDLSNTSLCSQKPNILSSAQIKFTQGQIIWAYPYL